jgi:hypothetical protein
VKFISNSAWVTIIELIHDLRKQNDRLQERNDALSQALGSVAGTRVNIPQSKPLPAQLSKPFVVPPSWSAKKTPSGGNTNET